MYQGSEQHIQYQKKLEKLHIAVSIAISIPSLMQREMEKSVLIYCLTEEFKFKEYEPIEIQKIKGINQ